MKLKRILNFWSATVISLSSLLSINLAVAHAATVTWTGAAGDHLFSTAGNWQSGSAPSNGDTITFPLGVSDRNPVNNLSSAIFPLIQFTGGSAGTTGYNITGNDIVIGNITDTSTSSNGNSLNVNMTVSGSSTFSGPTDSPLTIGDTNSLGSKTLTLISNVELTLTNVRVAAAISGPSDSLITSNNSDTQYGTRLMANNTGFSGSVDLSGGDILVQGSNPNATITATAGQVKGTGSVGTLTVTNPAKLAPGQSPGCITAGTLTLTGVFSEELGGTTACTEYDQVTVTTGPINLTGATLDVNYYNGFTPTVGQKFTIINNTSGTAINGTFANLTEGAIFTVGGHYFSITYKGNSQNDVVISAVNPPPVTASARAPSTGYKLVTNNPAASICVTIAASLGLLYLSRRFGRQAR